MTRALPATAARPAHVRDGAATRLSIEREALRLFARRGYDATSIRDISLAVGVADAALYRYFKSKEELGRAIFQDHYRRLAQDIMAVRESGRGFAGKVAALVDLMCALFDGTPDVFVFIMTNLHDHLRFVPDGAQENAVAALHEIMRDAIRDGELAPGDADLLAAMALGIVTQPAIFHLYGRLQGPLASHRAELAATVLRALGVSATAQVKLARRGARG